MHTTHNGGESFRSVLVRVALVTTSGGFLHNVIRRKVNTTQLHAK